MELTSTERVIGGRFHLIRRLGRRSAGSVWEARDDRGRREPIEVVLLSGAGGSDPQTVTRFRRAMALVLWPWFQHPAATRVLAYGEDGSKLFVVMQHVDGETLAARMQRDPPIPAEEAEHVASALQDVVGSAHLRGIVHGNLGSEHVVLLPDGQVKLLDLGVDRRIWADAAADAEAQAAIRSADLGAIERIRRSIGVAQALEEATVVIKDAHVEPVIVLPEVRSPEATGSPRTRRLPLPALILAGGVVALAALGIGIGIGTVGRGSPSTTSTAVTAPPPMASATAPPTGIGALPVPDVAGFTAADARSHVLGAGFRIAAVIPVAGTPGQVVRTDPVAGQLVPAGSGVTIYVGTTPDRLRREGGGPSP
jgi:serine/threonine protein kinase